MVMLAQKIDQLKSTMFGLFYVMTEGVVWDNTAAMRRKTYLIMLIDYLQVQRILCASKYGWTAASQNVVKHTDIVYICTSLISKVVPRYSLFIVASLLVLTALADTVYAAHLFKRGSIDRIWPLKVLRFLVATMVTTAFSSLIKWLMIPTDCLVSTERPTFSELVQGDGAPCSPFSLPEVLATAPMIILGLAYVAFALVTSHLSFEVNPLSRQPRAACTGRVEVLFAIEKVLATVIVYFAAYVTETAVTAVLFLGALVVLRAHLQYLPWHNYSVNLLRGGILACVVWMSFSSCLVAALNAGSVFQNEWQAQQLQYTLIGLLPVAFAGGIYAVVRRREAVNASLDRLRGDWELATQSDAHLASYGQGCGMSTGRASTMGGEDTNFDAASTKSRQAPRKTMYKSFFDPSLERKRAFMTSTEALTTARILLYKRREEDIPFLKRVVQRGIEEHPDATDLKLFKIALNRFVFRNSMQAAEDEKLLKTHASGLPIDYQYVLFVVERKATQANAQESIGGTVTSMNLMEWDAGINRARKAHKACIRRQKEFWKMMRKRRAHSEHVASEDISDILTHLDDFNASVEKAQAEYDTLMVNYSSSSALLTSYATFCDTVLNDWKKAEKLRSMVETNSDHGDFDKQMALEDKCTGSASSSENDNVRVVASRWLDSFSHNILGVEKAAIHLLDKKVKVSLVLLLIVTTVGFVLLDLGLLTETAIKNIHFIDETGRSRDRAYGAVFQIRNMHLAAIKGDRDAFEKAQKSLADAGHDISESHLHSYEGLISSNVASFFDTKQCPYVAPEGGRWMERETIYWKFVSEYQRYVQRAAAVTMEELADPDMNPHTISNNKLNIGIVMENTELDFIPRVEELVHLYEEELFEFGRMANLAVIIITAVNSTLSVILAFFVLRTLPKSIKALQFRYVSCHLAMSLPRNISQKMYKFFEELEIQMKILEDEELALELMKEEGEGAPPKDAQDSDDDDHVPALGGDDANLPLGEGGGDGDEGGSFRSDGGSGNGGAIVGHLSTENIERLKLGGDIPVPKGWSRTPLSSRKVTGSGKRGIHKPILDPPGLDARDLQGGDPPGTPPPSSKLFPGQNSGGLEDALADIHDVRVAVGPSPIRRVVDSSARGRNSDPGGHGGVDAYTEETHRGVEGGDKDEDDGDSSVPELADEMDDSSEGKDAADGVGARALLPSPYVAGAAKDKGTGVIPRSTHPRGKNQPMGQGEAAEGAFVPIATDGRGESRRPQRSPLNKTARQLNSAGTSSPYDSSSSLSNPRGAPPEGLEDGNGKLQSRMDVSGDDGGSACAMPTAGESTPHGPVGFPLFTIGGDQSNATSPVHGARGSGKGSQEGEEDAQAVGAGGCGASPAVADTRSLRASSPRPILRNSSGGESPLIKPRSPTPSSPRKTSFEGLAHVRMSGLELEPGASSQFNDKATHTLLGRISGRSKVSEEAGNGSALKNQQPTDFSARATSGSFNKTLSRSRSLLSRTPDPKPPSEEYDGKDGVLSKITDATLGELNKELVQRQAWYTRTPFYCIVFFVIIGLCIFSMLYPMRLIPHVVNMGPTANQAARRRFQTRALVFYLRELALNDRFTRLSHVEATLNIRHYRDELKTSDLAVRRGGMLHIHQGADFRNQEHNRVMYDLGCPWNPRYVDDGHPHTEDLTHYCLGSQNIDAVSHGLSYLYSTFDDAVGNTLGIYGDEDADTFEGKPITEEQEWQIKEDERNARLWGDKRSLYGEVDLNATRNGLRLLESDEDLSFIMEAFDQDLYQGWDYTMGLFQRESDHLLEEAHFEFLLFYCVYVGALLCLFYLILFRRSLHNAVEQANRAQEWVYRMPFHTLSKDQRGLVELYFVGSEQMEAHEAELSATRVEERVRRDSSTVRLTKH